MVMSFQTSHAMTISEIPMKPWMEIDRLQNAVPALHPAEEDTLTANSFRALVNFSRGTPANFYEGDYVFIARSTFHKGENRCPRWRGPHRVTKVLSQRLTHRSIIWRALNKEQGLFRLFSWCKHSHVACLALRNVNASSTSRSSLLNPHRPFYSSSLERPPKLWGYDRTVVTSLWRRAPNAPQTTLPQEHASGYCNSSSMFTCCTRERTATCHSGKYQLNRTTSFDYEDWSSSLDARVWNCLNRGRMKHITAWSDW